MDKSQKPVLQKSIIDYKVCVCVSCLCKCACVCMFYTYTYIYIYVCVCVCVSVYKCVYIYINMQYYGITLQFTIQRFLLLHNLCKNVL